jgi:chromosome segregation ATPase
MDDEDIFKPQPATPIVFDRQTILFKLRNLRLIEEEIDIFEHSSILRILSKLLVYKQLDEESKKRLKDDIDSLKSELRTLSKDSKLIKAERSKLEAAQNEALSAREELKQYKKKLTESTKIAETLATDLQQKNLLIKNLESEITQLRCQLNEKTNFERHLEETSLTLHSLPETQSEERTSIFASYSKHSEDLTITEEEIYESFLLADGA